MFTPDYLLGRMAVHFVADATSLHRTAAAVRSEVARTVLTVSSSGRQIAQKAMMDTAATLGYTARQMQGVEAAALRMENLALGSLLAIRNGVQSALGAMGALGATMTSRISVPLTILGALSLREFGRFDEALNHTMAALDSTDVSVRNMMEGLSLGISGRSTTGPVELARSLYFLATAGYDAHRSIAALPVVEKFAVAGLFDMEKATRLLTGAQNALGMSSEITTDHITNMTRVMDVMTMAGVRSNATTEELSESLTHRAAAALRLVNKEVEEGAAILGIFASQNIRGRVAGERLAIMLRDLQSAAIRNGDAWARYGLSVYDSTGSLADIDGILRRLQGVNFPGVESMVSELQELRNTNIADALAGVEGAADVSKALLQDLIVRFNEISTMTGAPPVLREISKELQAASGRMLPIADIIEQLERRMVGMGDQAKRALLMRLGFQDRSVSAILPLLGRSQEIRDFENALRGAEGTVERMYQIHLRSFSAQMKILWNNVVGAAIDIGRTLAPMLAGVNGIVTSGLNAWKQLPEGIKSTVVAMGLLLALTGPTISLLKIIAGLVLGIALNPLTMLFRGGVIAGAFAFITYLPEILGAIPSILESIGSAISSILAPLEYVGAYLAVLIAIWAAWKVAVLAAGIALFTFYTILGFVTTVMAPLILLIKIGLIGSMVMLKTAVVAAVVAFLALKTAAVAFTAGLSFVTVVTSLISMVAHIFAVGGALLSIVFIIGLVVAIIRGAVAAVGAFVDSMRGIGDTIMTAFKGIKDALSAGEMRLAFQILAVTIEIIWLRLIEAMKSAWNAFVREFRESDAVKHIEALLSAMNAPGAVGIALRRAQEAQAERDRVLRIERAQEFTAEGVRLIGMNAQGFGMETAWARLSAQVLAEAQGGNENILGVLSQIMAEARRANVEVPPWASQMATVFSQRNAAAIANSPLGRIADLETRLRELTAAAQHRAQAASFVPTPRHIFDAANLAGLMGASMDPLSGMVRSLMFRGQSAQEQATQAAGIVGAAVNPLAGLTMAGTAGFGPLGGGRLFRDIQEALELGRPVRSTGQFQQVALSRFDLEGPGGLAGLPPKGQEVRDTIAHQKQDRIINVLGGIAQQIPNIGQFLTGNNR